MDKIWKLFRYVNVDLASLEASDAKGDELCCTQHPKYEDKYKANREKALGAAMAYIHCRELSEASLLLYQVTAI